MAKYTSSSGQTLEEITFSAIEEGTTPRYIYKYRGDNSFTNQIISELKLYYPSPVKFNDPFDCRLILDTTNTRREIEDFIRMNNPRMKSKEIKARTLEWHKNPDLFHQAINIGAQTTLGASGVCCFVSDAENILMWSHYADSHKGLCLKFDVLEDLTAFSPLFKVEYAEEYPVINHATQMPGASVTQLITTKAKLWEYEQEWRVFKMHESGKHPFKKTALVEIIFGSSATAQFISNIKALVRAAGMNHIVFKKAYKSLGRFAVDIRSL